jgi:hypothetical protein
MAQSGGTKGGWIPAACHDDGQQNRFRQPVGSVDQTGKAGQSAIEHDVFHLHPGQPWINLPIGPPCAVMKSCVLAMAGVLRSASVTSSAANSLTPPLIIRSV